MVGVACSEERQSEALALPGIFCLGPKGLVAISPSHEQGKNSSILALRLHELRPELGFEVAQGNLTLNCLSG